jgi:hypothetical protein
LVVDYLQKDARVEGYKAITHDMVTSAVRPHFLEHGIVVELHQQTASLTDTGKTTRGGTPITVYQADYHIHFVNMDEPTDRAIVSIGATAEDHGDKGPAKCASYATKTAILKILSIETGESDESRQSQKPVYINEDQVIEIEDLIKEKGPDMDRFWGYAGAKSVDKILAVNYNRVLSALKEKK